MKRLKPRNRDRRLRSGIAIVGPGRLGQAMGKLLGQGGFSVLFVAGRRLARARRAVRFIGGGRAILLSQPEELTKAGVILLTVTDAGLPKVVRELAAYPPGGPTRSATRGRKGNGWSGKVVLHTCGSLPSSVLRPLKRHGASIGSLHPFQTVPNPRVGVRNLRGCFWGVEGERRALAVAHRWVKSLGGVAFRVRPTQKTKYHLAAFMVCPTVVTLLERSLHFLKLAGVPAQLGPPMLVQFVGETARNFAELGARGALTGPAVRGDWPTIRRHVAVLRRFSPKTVPVYRALVRAMLHLAGRRRYGARSSR